MTKYPYFIYLNIETHTLKYNSTLTYKCKQSDTELQWQFKSGTHCTYGIIRTEDPKRTREIYHL